MLNIKSIASRVGSLVYPNVCLCCYDKGENGRDLCSRCYARLPWIENACDVCALPLEEKPHSSSLLCGKCASKHTWQFDHAYAPLLYEEFVRTAVHKFKFNYKLNYGKLLAELLARHVIENNISIPEILIPVPLHKKRIQQRGFNQALEIAKILAKQFDCAVSKNAIQRTRETKTQVELAVNKRKANVKNAFKLRQAENFAGVKHVTIIDDVMTTGATVNELAKCVKSAGIARVDVWCVARVP